ncbi:MAG: hypothetical protein JW973_03370 [Bacteroidales bacterium]|nr:hypothetical protein [Bacteroidales bacterium]
MIRLCSILFFLRFILPLYSQVNESQGTPVTDTSLQFRSSVRGIINADSIFSRTYLRLTSLANFDSLAITAYDKILTYSHDVFIVRIHNITPSFVLFLYPFNTDLNSLNRNEISQIQYADGTIDIFLPLADKTGFDSEIVDTARIIIRNRRDWEKVTLTNKSEDIAGLIEKGRITASYQADFINAENAYLEKNAGIILRKKAANLNAPFVLLLNKSFHKAYGDPPSIELEGIVYNYE